MLVKGSDQEVEDSMQAIRTAQELARTWAQVAREEYEAELDQDRRYRHLKLRTLPMGSVVLQKNVAVSEVTDLPFSPRACSLTVARWQEMLAGTRGCSVESCIL